MAELRIALSEIPEDGMTQVAEDGREVLLVRRGETVHALGAHCPHHHAPLAEGVLHGDRLLCPWHQSVFDVDNGELLEPPALDCLDSYPARVDGDEVVVELPDEADGVRAPELTTEEPVADDRTFAIIGSGAAAVAAAQELRRVGYQGRLVMVSRDDRDPYDRTNCSKDYLAGSAEPEWMPLRSPEMYTDAGIERITHEVRELDVSTRRIPLPQGATLEADALLLAPGAEPRTLDVPGSDLDGVFTLRTWSDADRIIAAADTASRALVVGASFIAMEAAASLRQRGVDTVTVVAPETEPFAAVLGEEVGGVLRSIHEENGVRFRLGRQVEAFEDNGGVAAAVLDNGDRVATDLVVIGVGVRPATGFLRGVELESDGSVRTDESLRVAAGVWAAGDIATFPDPRTGEGVRIEHWRLAQQHGQTAARNMAGATTAYRGTPFFWTMHFGTSLGYVGHASRWDEVILHGSLDEKDFIAFYVAGDRLLAAAGIGRDRQLDALHELMLEGREPSPERVRAGELDLTELL
mgnify:CR=1 FL=1